MASSKAADHKYIAFARAFVKCKKGPQAAVIAGYSKKAAAQAASRLLRKPQVQAEIAKLEAELATKVIVDVERVLRECARIAIADPRLLFNDDGTVKDPKDWPDELAANIASIEVDEIIEGRGKDRRVVGYTKKVKFWDKNSSLERMFKHLGMFEKDNKQLGKAIAKAIVVPRKEGQR